MPFVPGRLGSDCYLRMCGVASHQLMITLRSSLSDCMTYCNLYQGQTVNRTLSVSLSNVGC